VSGPWRLDVEPSLRARTAEAVDDRRLAVRTARAVDRFAGHRAHGLAELDDADALRHAARATRQAVLADLPELAARFADKVVAAGGHVHWAASAASAREYVLDVCRRHGARTVVKSKSMVTEEIALNAALEAAAVEVVETDLGEWIIQLAREHPSHIIAPAIHHDRVSIAALFAAHGRTETGDDPEQLNAYARAELRAKFLAADVGISGGNLGVAETGTIVLVSNEGNARLSTSLPPVHVAVMGIERLVADWSQADLLLSLLVRSATGQRLSSYTSFVTGPSPGDGGPEELHVVLLDAGRSDLLGTEDHEMLGCIRCGACLNACPVYRQVGGHAYGWVYPGPMGAVLTPLLAGDRPAAADLPKASTLCGACMDACPVEIPLQDLLLNGRRRRVATGQAPTGEAAAWRAWAAAWSRPSAYRATTKAAGWSRFLGRHLASLPGAGRWAHGRAVPAPAAERFRDRWPFLTDGQSG
jgi:L-lactate dehydrogenase complex protein LldF